MPNRSPAITRSGLNGEQVADIAADPIRNATTIKAGYKAQKQSYLVQIALQAPKQVEMVTPDSGQDHKTYCLR